VGDDAGTVGELLSDYLASARHLAAELRAAVVAGNTQQVGAVAHKLKSSSRSVGALAFGDLCAGLESAGRVGDKVGSTQDMPKFEAALTAVEAEIAGLLAGQ
jgi:HPt (histidine-containing phosphotransfer) domain-containing protein